MRSIHEPGKKISENTLFPLIHTTLIPTKVNTW